jgi:hypothetical protein
MNPIDTLLGENERSRFVRLNGKRPSESVENQIAALDFDTVLFVGSGAVENGWKPIAQICSDIISRQFHGLVDYGPHNSYFYNEPYDHFLTSIAFTETSIRTKLPKILENPNFQNLDSWKMYSNAIATRERLAEQFCKTNDLRLRPLNYEKFQLDLDRTLVVTSNWDDCIWSESAFKNVVYLHGHCKVKNSLVLPTQFVTDEFPLKYWADARLQINNATTSIVRANIHLMKDALKALPHFIGLGKRDLQLELNYPHDLFREAISNEKLKRIFMWGYGFNLYDAEVNLLLTLASVVNPLRTVEILNPDPTVLLKAAQILGREISDIAYHHPTR